MSIVEHHVPHLYFNWSHSKLICTYESNSNSQWDKLVKLDDICVEAELIIKAAFLFVGLFWHLEVEALQKEQPNPQPEHFIALQVYFGILANNYVCI